MAKAVEAYQDWREQEALAWNKQRHLRTDKYILARLKDHFGHLHIGAISRAAVRAYQALMRKQKYSDGTTRKHLVLLTAALNHARKEGWIDTVPHIDKPASPPARERWMTPEQVKDFLEHCATPHVRLFAMLALYTLSRKQAILDLTWDRVDLEGRRVDFNLPDMPESSKRRVVARIESKALLAELERARELAETDFVIEYAGRAIMDIKKSFSGAAHAAGMPWVTPHILRHTGATLLAARGLSMFELAGMMGDTPETVARHYAKHSPEHMKKGAKMLEKLYG